MKDTPEEMARVERTSRNSGTRKLLNKLSSAIHLLDRYTSVIDTLIQFNPKPSALIWGGVKLIVTVAVKYAALFEALIDVLRRISEVFPKLQKYEGFFSTEELRKIVLLTYKDTLDMLSFAHKTFSASANMNAQEEERRKADAERQSQEDERRKQEDARMQQEAERHQNQERYLRDERRREQEHEGLTPPTNTNERSVDILKTQIRVLGFKKKSNIDSPRKLIMEFIAFGFILVRVQERESLQALLFVICAKGFQQGR
ncbi:hypothetical protein K440DRAFT_636648 [Wilcoxina mikolae CBS 423.85]|nr:hypothetical protein K440DRAFT_636648 [Wilcoxina mikolae CBS 423.85]